MEGMAQISWPMKNLHMNTIITRNHNIAILYTVESDHSANSHMFLHFSIVIHIQFSSLSFCHLRFPSHDCSTLIYFSNWVFPLSPGRLFIKIGTLFILCQLWLASSLLL